MGWWVAGENGIKALIFEVEVEDELGNMKSSIRILFGALGSDQYGHE